MKISRYLNLNKTQYELDFVDINIKSDTPLFIDPHLIGNLKSRFAEKINIMKRFLIFKKKYHIFLKRKYTKSITGKY